MESGLRGLFRVPVSFESRKSFIEAEIVQLYQGSRLDKGVEALMFGILGRLQALFRDKELDIRCSGSVFSGFATCASDLDIVLILPQTEAESSELALNQLASLLPDLCTETWYRSYQILDTARVPIAIIQVETQGTAFEMDLIPHPYGQYGYHNSCLLRLYASIHPYVAILGVVVKVWARKRGINDTRRGDGLSSYTFVVLLVAFLQRLQPQPLLPFLQQDCVGRNRLNGHDFSYREDIAADIRKARALDLSLAGLLEGFFRYYSAYDWGGHRVDICTLETAKERDFQMVIQDPFLRNRNLADVLKQPGAVFKVKGEFGRAYKVLSSPNSSLSDLFED